MAVVALAAIGLFAHHESVRVRKLPTPNPTSYTFPLPLRVVRAGAIQAFGHGQQSWNPTFSDARDYPAFSDFRVEHLNDAVFGEAIFQNPANSNDVYLHSFHTPILRSSVYHRHDEGLPFIAAFHLHIVPQGSNTTVSVTALDAEVVVGQKFGIGPCGFGFGNAYKNVKPTTVEEYTLLRYLGGYLHFTNMPEVVLPKR